MQRLQLLLTLVSGLEQICFDLELVGYYSQLRCLLTNFAVHRPNCLYQLSLKVMQCGYDF